MRHGPPGAGTMGGMSEQHPDASDRPAPVSVGDEAPVPATVGDEAPAPRSHYALTRKNTSLRNGLWALGVMFAIVMVVGVLFLGVGNQPRREVPENDRVDVASSAERASSLASFPLAVPEPGNAWRPRSARFADVSGGRWTVGYTSPSGALVSLEQAGEVTPALIQDAVPGAHSDGEIEVEGLRCETFAGEADGKGSPDRAVVCPGEGWGFVVSGRTDQDELAALAEASARSLQG